MSFCTGEWNRFGVPRNGSKTGYTDLFKLFSLRYSGKLFDAIARHKFEDIELPITSEYDSYLSIQYGDYMTPPKQEDRNPIHMSSD